MNTDYIVILDPLKQVDFGNPVTLPFNMTAPPSKVEPLAVLQFMVQVTTGTKSMQLQIKLNSAVDILLTAGFDGPEFHSVHEVFEAKFLQVGANTLTFIGDPTGQAMGTIKVSDVVLWYKRD